MPFVVGCLADLPLDRPPACCVRPLRQLSSAELPVDVEAGRECLPVDDRQHHRSYAFPINVRCSALKPHKWTLYSVQPPVRQARSFSWSQPENQLGAPWLQSASR